MDGPFPSLCLPPFLSTGIVYFCPFLKMEGAFSYCNDLVMIVSKKEGEKNPNQPSGSHKQKRQGRGSVTTWPLSLPRHLQFRSRAEMEHL